MKRTAPAPARAEDSLPTPEERRAKRRKLSAGRRGFEWYRQPEADDWLLDDEAALQVSAWMLSNNITFLPRKGREQCQCECSWCEIEMVASPSGDGEDTTLWCENCTGRCARCGERDFDRRLKGDLIRDGVFRNGVRWQERWHQVCEECARDNNDTCDSADWGCFSDEEMPEAGEGGAPQLEAVDPTK